MKDKSTYFYGIDFKKMQLYCKVVNTVNISYLYRKHYKTRLQIDSNKYYEVITTYHQDEQLEIIVDCIKMQNGFEANKNGFKSLVEHDVEDRIKIKLNFADVEFSYFFEKTREQELDVRSIF